MQFLDFSTNQLQFFCRDEFSDALLNCEDREGKAMSMNGDGNFENGEDEEADDEDEGDEDEYGDVQDAGGDEPHSLQVTTYTRQPWLKYLGA